VKSKSIRFVPVLIALVVLGLVCLLRSLPDILVNPSSPEQTRFDAFQRLEWMTYDWRVRQARSFPSANFTNLAFVFIDDDSIEKLQSGFLIQQPYGLLWPRHIYGTLVHELAGQGAEAIGFDVLFSPLRPDHPRWPKLAKGASNRVDTVGSDDFFAKQMALAGNVIVAAQQSVVPPELFRTNAWGMADISADKDSDGILRRVYAFRDYPVWHPAFEEVRELNNWKLQHLGLRTVRFIDAITKQVMREVPIDNNGTFAVEDLLGQKPDPDDPTRDSAYFMMRAWHMGIMLAAKHLGLDLENAEVDLEGGRITFRAPNGTVRQLPVDRFGRLFVNWSIMARDPKVPSGQAHPDLTIANIDGLLQMGVNRQMGVLEGETNRFKGKLVVVGSGATGSNLADIGATPLSSQTFYASTHWNVANSMITGSFIRRASAFQEQLLIIALGFLAAFLTWMMPPSTATLSVIASAMGYLILSFVLFVKGRFWLPLVLPVGGGLILTHISLVTYRVIFEESERRRVKSLFSRLVSPNVVNELLKQEKLSLGGARRRITVFFADVRGFTQMTDDNQAKAEAYVKQYGLTGAAAEAHYDENARRTLETVNLYLATIAETIKTHDGTLDKYIGDCVMAFWGEPTPNVKHAVSCVRAAIDAQRAMHSLNQSRAVENERIKQENEAREAAGQPLLPYLPLLSLGTGINTGEAIVGLMGNEATIVNFTVFGREINLASRLEGVSGRGRIVIGEATQQDLLKFDPELAATSIELDPVTPKGFSKPIRIFEVPWRPQQLQAPGA
jgi:class 3 adenylate cyclase/CHASE2 domain-containing sensor protein